MNTIADQWKRFEESVLSPAAPPVQRSEMRRAFYAGVWAILNLQLQMASSDLSEDASTALLQSWHEECTLFASEVSAGRA